HHRAAPDGEVTQDELKPALTQPDLAVVGVDEAGIRAQAEELDESAFHRVGLYGARLRSLVHGSPNHLSEEDAVRVDIRFVGHTRSPAEPCGDVIQASRRETTPEMAQTWYQHASHG